MFLLRFELIGFGDQKTLLCELVDVCVIGCRTEGEVDHWVETLSICGEKAVMGSRKLNKYRSALIVLHHDCTVCVNVGSAYIVKVLVLYM